MVSSSKLVSGEKIVEDLKTLFKMVLSILLKMTRRQSKSHLECQGLHSVTKESQFNKVDMSLKIAKEGKHKEVILTWNHGNKNPISQYTDPSISVTEGRIWTFILDHLMVQNWTI